MRAYIIKQLTMKHFLLLLTILLTLLPACKTRDKGKEKPEKKVEKAEREKPAEPAINFQEFESEVFTLENDQAWAYFLAPSSPPTSWDEYGFIFTQSAIQDFRMICLDGETGKKKSMEDCDPMMGDEINIYGNIPDEKMEEMKEILGSIGFG